MGSDTVDGYGNVDNWKIFKVTDMSSMFEGAEAFSGEGLTTWAMDGSAAPGTATPRLLTTESMFKNAKKFNAAINTVAVAATNNNIWDMAAVTDMDSMFENAEIFNQPLTDWVTTNLLSTNSMFKNALLFNNDVFSATATATSKVVNMDSMFENARDFNQPCRTSTDGNNDAITSADIWKVEA